MPRRRGRCTRISRPRPNRRRELLRSRRATKGPAARPSASAAPSTGCMNTTTADAAGLTPPLRLRSMAPWGTGNRVRSVGMTYVVNENCIKCKYTDCVEVCPVDCFYEGENMLVIHPDECIDCGVCEPECPADAIKPDTEPGLEKWLEVNTEYAKSWPNITQKKESPADAKDFEGMEGKFEKYFSPNPGSGD